MVVQKYKECIYSGVCVYEPRCLIEGQLQGTRRLNSLSGVELGEGVVLESIRLYTGVGGCKVCTENVSMVTENDKERREYEVRL